jgi:hypothetical protein
MSGSGNNKTVEKVKECWKDPKFKICSIVMMVLVVVLIVLICMSLMETKESKSNYGLLFRTYELAKRYNTHPNFKGSETSEASEGFTDRGQRFFTTGFDYLSKKPVSESTQVTKTELANKLVDETKSSVENISSENIPLTQQQPGEEHRDTSINAESGITGTTYDSGENVDIKPEAVSNSGQVVETSPVEGFGTLRYMNNFGDLTQQGLNGSKIAQAEANENKSVSLDQQAMAEKMGFRFKH